MGLVGIMNVLFVYWHDDVLLLEYVNLRCPFLNVLIPLFHPTDDVSPGIQHRSWKRLLPRVQLLIEERVEDPYILGKVRVVSYKVIHPKPVG